MFVEELGMKHTVYVVKTSCPPLLSLGRICKEHNIGYVWPAGTDDPYLQATKLKPSKKTFRIYLKNNVPLITSACKISANATPGVDPKPENQKSTFETQETFEERLQSDSPHSAEDEKKLIPSSPSDDKPDQAT